MNSGLHPRTSGRFFNLWFLHTPKVSSILAGVQAVTIFDNMQTEKRQLKDLRKADYNPRTITPESREALAKNLAKYGLLEPIVVNDHKCPKCGDRRNVIVGGHQRAEVAQDLGITEAEVSLVNLHIAYEKLLNLSLNKNGGEFDTPKLKRVVKKITEEAPADILLSGFGEEDVENLMRPIDIDFDVAFAKIPDDDETEEGQMTFNLSRRQYNRVTEALEKAQARFKSPTGKSEAETWGFALIKICQNYGKQNDQGLGA